VNEPYPVVFDVERPPTFERAHVVLRIVLLVVIGWIAHPIGLPWLGVPLVAAILIAQKGEQRYLDEEGSTVTRILGLIVELAAYLALVTDRLPGEGAQSVSFRVERSSPPTLGAALLRIVNVIPSLIVLAILTFIGSIVWVIAVVGVLVNERYPERMWRFLLGLVRWEGFVLAYLASLVDRYPPFTLQTASVSPAAPSAG
jgi:Domain of unknown function (DUF4389)